MAWEDRNGKQYYYRKCRVGKQIISEYIGGGLAGELSALYDNEDRFKTDVQRAELMQAKADAARLDRDVRRAREYTQAFTRAILLLSGYHAPRRQWRKMRKNER
jgi:hypothetical protein